MEGLHPSLPARPAEVLSSESGSHPSSVGAHLLCFGAFSVMTAAVCGFPGNRRLDNRRHLFRQWAYVASDILLSTVSYFGETVYENNICIPRLKKIVQYMSCKQASCAVCLLFALSLLEREQQAPSCIFGI